MHLSDDLMSTGMCIKDIVSCKKNRGVLKGTVQDSKNPDGLFIEPA